MANVLSYFNRSDLIDNLLYDQPDSHLDKTRGLSRIGVAEDELECSGKALETAQTNYQNDDQAAQNAVNHNRAVPTNANALAAATAHAKAENTRNQLAKAEMEFEAKCTAYEMAVERHNERHKKNPKKQHPLNRSLMQRSTASEFEKLHDKRGIKDIYRENRLPTLREVGEPIDVKSMPEKDMTPDEATASCVQAAYNGPPPKEYEEEVKKALGEDKGAQVKCLGDYFQKKLKEGISKQNPIPGVLVRALINSRDSKSIQTLHLIPDGKLMTPATKTELYSLMLRDSRNGLYRSLNQFLNNRPSYEIPTGNETLAQAHGANQQRQANALAALGLAPANVTIKMIQEKLGEWGPDDQRVKNFFRALNLPADQNNELNGWARSQHNLEETARLQNDEIKKFNKKRVEDKDPVQSELNNLRSVEDWNKRVATLPPEADKTAPAIAAAAQVSGLLLDDKQDLSADALKDKISQPVKDASRQNATPDAANAAEAMAIRAIDKVHSHFEGASADVPAFSALSALAASSYILERNDFNEIKDFKDSKQPNQNNRNKQGQALRRSITEHLNQVDGLGNAVSIIQTTIQVQSSTQLAFSSPDVQAAINSSQESERANAQLKVAKVASLSAAIYSALRLKGVAWRDAAQIKDVIVNDYILYNQIDEKAISAIMQPYPAASAHSALIMEVSKAALAITEGVKASNSAISDAEAHTTSALKAAGFSEGLSAAISKNIHKRFIGDSDNDVAEAWIDDDAIIDARDAEIRRANNIINAIYEVKSDSFTAPDLKREREEGEQEREVLITKCKRKIANDYAATGKISLDSIVQSISPILNREHALNWLPDGGVQTIAENLMDVINPLLTADDPQQPQLHNDRPSVNIPVSAEMGTLRDSIQNAYSSISEKAAQKGAEAAASELKIAAAEAKKIGEAAGNKIKKNPRKRRKAALEAAKLLPSGENFAARVAVSAVVGRGVGLPGGKKLPSAPEVELRSPKMPDSKIRSAYSHGVPRLTLTTATAMMTAIAEWGTDSNIPPSIIGAAANTVADFFLRHPDTALNWTNLQNYINHMPDPNVVAETLHSMRDPQTNFGFAAQPPIPDVLLDTIRDQLVDHYKAHGVMDNKIAYKLISDAIGAYNTANAGANIPIPGLERIQAFSPIVRIMALPNPRNASTVIADANIPPDQKISLVRRAYEAYVISISDQAVKNAEAAHPMDQKEEAKRPHFRKVAAAVCASALAGRCSQAEALKLSKIFTQYYVTHGSFDALNLAAFEAEVRKVLPNRTADERVKLAEVTHLLSRAAPAAASLKKEDAVAAGTLVASKVCFTFEKPEHASSIAAAVAAASKGDPRAVGNAAAYAEGFTSKVLASPAIGLAVASTVTNNIKAMSGGDLNDNGGVLQGWPEWKFNANGGVLQGGQGWRFDPDGADDLGNAVRDTITQIQNEGNYDDTHPNQIHVHADISGSLVAEVVGELANSLGNKLGTPQDRDNALSMLANGAAIAGNTVITGLKMGLSPEEAKTLAKHLAHKSTLERMRTNNSPVGHDSDPLVTGLVSLASMKIDACLAAINQMYTTTNPQAVANPYNENALLNLPAYNYPVNAAANPVPLTAEMISAKANEEYLRAKNACGFGNSPQQKAAAELIGRKAAMKVCLDAIQNHQFASEKDFKAVVSLANHAADSAAQSLEDYRQTEIAAHPHLVEVPKSISRKELSKIIRSNTAASLLQQGINAGTTQPLNPPPNFQDDNESRAYRAIYAIIQAYNGRAPLDQKIDHTKLGADQFDDAKVREIMSRRITEQEKGVLVSELLTDAPREVSKAIAGVIAHFSLPDNNLNDDLARRSKAIAIAGAASAVRDERALPSELAGNERRAIEQYENDKQDRIKKALNSAYMAKLEAEANLPDDLLGISETIRNDNLDVECKITTHNLNQWTFRFSGDEANKTHNIEDLPDFKDLIPDLKDCEGYLTPESFEKAIADFNAKRENKHELQNWFREKLGFLSVLGLRLQPLPPTVPIKKEALKRTSDGGLELKTKGLSRSEVKELFQDWIRYSRIAKQNAQTLSAGKANPIANAASRVEPASQRLGRS